MTDKLTVIHSETGDLAQDEVLRLTRENGRLIRELGIASKRLEAIERDSYMWEEEYGFVGEQVYLRLQRVIAIATCRVVRVSEDDHIYAVIQDGVTLGLVRRWYRGADVTSRERLFRAELTGGQTLGDFETLNEAAGEIATEPRAQGGS